MNRTEEPPDHGIGKSRGGLSTKIHHLVDGNGMPLVVVCAPGQAGDAPMFPVLIGHLRVNASGPGRPRTRPDKVRGDKAYSSKAIRELLSSRGIEAASRNQTTSSETANAKVVRAAGHRSSMPTITRAATSLNAAANGANNGAPSPLATTNTTSTTAAASSSTRSSLGSNGYETRSSRERVDGCTSRSERSSLVIVQVLW